jgi:hypothetical protein
MTLSISDDSARLTLCPLRPGLYMSLRMIAYDVIVFTSGVDFLPSILALSIRVVQLALVEWKHRRRQLLPSLRRYSELDSLDRREPITMQRIESHVCEQNTDSSVPLAAVRGLVSDHGHHGYRH